MLVPLSSQGFLAPLVTDTLDQLVLHSRGCPVHCRVTSNTPDLYPFDASGTLLPYCLGIVTIKSSDIAKYPLEDMIYHPHWRTTALSEDVPETGDWLHKGLEKRKRKKGQEPIRRESSCVL